MEKSTKHKKRQNNNKKTVDEITDVFSDERKSSPPKENEKKIKAKKGKTIIKKNMRGKPVYLEDTGEKLGTVFDTTYDEKRHLVGYKIKDGKSDAVLSFPFNQFEEGEKGLIFIPGWYAKAVKTIEKLEFKDRISPELTALLTDDAVSSKELYDIFVKHNDEMSDYMKSSISLMKTIKERLNVLEKERISLKGGLMDLTEKRLIKDIDRRKFSEDVLKHRHKVHIVDININKCKELLRRLDLTSFGILDRSNILADGKMGESHEGNYDDSEERNGMSVDMEMENHYKEKYYVLKDQFEQLDDEHHQLKTAVNALLNREES